MLKGNTTETDEAKLRVLVLAPQGRDGDRICRLLHEAGLAAEMCADVADISARLADGAGALVVDQETIDAAGAWTMLQDLHTSPTAADIPILILHNGSGHEPGWHRAAQRLGESANVVLLDRPLRPWTILSTVRLALSARRRQYESRRQMEEYRRAEQALRESEEKFRTLAENARASFGIVQGTQFVYVNPYFAEVSGYTIDELLTMDFPDLVHPDFRPVMLERARRRQMGEPVPNHYEFMMITKSGQVRWVEFSVGSILYKGKPAIIGTGFDITERKQAAERLRQGEELLRLAQLAGRVGTFEWNIQTGVVTWSPELEALYGLKPGSFGGTYQAWISLIHAPDRPQADQRFHEALETGSFEAEWRVVPPDGSVHWVAARGWVMKDEQGGPRRMVGVNICITERRRAEDALRRSEEQRRLAIKAAQLGGWDIDLIRQECTLDERCREIWAAPDWVTVPMDWIYGRVHPEDRASVVERIARGVADPDGSGMGVLEFRIVWPDGQVRWLRAAGHAILTETDGQLQPTHAVGATLDITDQKRYEQYLESLNETLEQRVAERTAVAEQRAEQLRALATELTNAEQRERRRLAQVLHDHLQQLLVGMKFRLATLGRQVDQPELIQNIDQIADLLEESILTSRSLTAELSPPILYDRGLPAALHWLASWMHDKHRLEVEVAADEDANPPREDLRVLLYQAVRELLFNVVKHAQAPRAAIRASRYPQEDCIRVTVTDEGAGFDPDILTRGHQASGGGFGLFSIRERLEVLGGTMEIDAEPGRGTTVMLQVPVAEDSAPEPYPPQPAASGPVPVPSRAGPVRILLADDHRMFRDGLAGMLRVHPDLDVIGEAGDGQVAVELARRLHPDVVLMDVTLPEVDGVEATRRIAAELPGICVIGLSMHSHGDMADAMRSAGAAAYVTKSQPPEEVIHAIRACSHRSM